MRGLVGVLAVVGVAVSQKQARIGPDGKPLLNRPDLAECMKRKINRVVKNTSGIVS